MSGEHEHTEACESTAPLLTRLNDGGKQLTESQFRELRGKYFTIRHPRVKDCGHALDVINEPTFRNCQTCWFSFFSTHAELVTVTDEAFQEHGTAFVDKMRGRQYRKMFIRFMATMARFKQESDALKAQEILNGQQSGEVQGGGAVGKGDGQGERGNSDVSTAGEPCQQAGTIHPKQSNIS